MSATQPDQSSAFPSSHRVECALPSGVAGRCLAWLPDRAPRASLVVVCADGADENWSQSLQDSLENDDCAVFAWHVDSGNVSPAAKSVEQFIRHIEATHGAVAGNMVVVGVGAAAIAVAAWVHDYAPLIRAMVLLAPVFRKGSFLPVPLAGAQPRPRVGKVRNLFRFTADRLIADAAAIRVPTLLLAAGRASRADLSRQQRFYQRLGTPIKRMKLFPDARPDLLHGPDCGPVLESLTEFAGEILPSPPARIPLLQAHRYGYTRDEYDRMITPLRRLSPRWCFYEIMRRFNRALGLFSPGLRLGWQKGFDSGEMLDYAYQNRAQGGLLLGRWVDRIFLNNISWHGCRSRRRNTAKLLREAVLRTSAAGQPVRLLDIASGPGRYVLETLRDFRDIDISALLLDNTASNLDAGRELAGQLGVTTATFQLGDAFNQHSLATVVPTPNIAIASGIYQLFNDNDLVLRSLRGLAEALRGGGYLVYTGLPWEPQLEMIARTVVNRNGGPSVVRRRTQEELDDLVRAAGFEKILSEADDFGLSTVSLAKRA
jgi:SAM-dependent methyltransferase